MSLSAWRMSSITAKEDPAMFHEMLSQHADPDVLVFWMITTLSSLFALFAPIAL